MAPLYRNHFPEGIDFTKNVVKSKLLNFSTLPTAAKFHSFLSTLKIKKLFTEKEPQHFCQGSGKSFLMGSTDCLLLHTDQKKCSVNG
jgi:hypothetical protein